jgi:hypothetical protein
VPRTFSAWFGVSAWECIVFDAEHAEKREQQNVRVVATAAKVLGRTQR